MIDFKNRFSNLQCFSYQGRNIPPEVRPDEKTKDLVVNATWCATNTLENLPRLFECIYIQRLRRLYDFTSR
jgi:hypothetical protein